jgi:hypothetical protein
MANRINCLLLLILFACSEDAEPTGCFECTTVVDIPGGNTEIRKGDRCDLETQEALEINSRGAITVMEVIDGNEVQTKQSTTCERKPN